MTVVIGEAGLYTAIGEVGALSTAIGDVGVPTVIGDVGALSTMMRGRI